MNNGTLPQLLCVFPFQIVFRTLVSQILDRTEPLLSTSLSSEVVTVFQYYSYLTSHGVSDLESYLCQLARQGEAAPELLQEAPAGYPVTGEGALILRARPVGPRGTQDPFLRYHSHIPINKVSFWCLSADLSSPRTRILTDGLSTRQGSWVHYTYSRKIAHSVSLYFLPCLFSYLTI